MGLRSNAQTMKFVRKVLILFSVIIFTPLVTHAQTGVGAQMEAGRKALTNGDFERSFDLVAPLADIGIPQAQHLLGRLHLKSEFAGYDVYEAFRLLGLAAEQGLPNAQHDLAQMYRTGVGVDKDALTAFSWHLKAARQRFALSEQAISEMYRTGIGVGKDEAQAEKWAQRAASKNRGESERPTIAAGPQGKPKPSLGTDEVSGRASSTTSAKTVSKSKSPARPMAASGTAKSREVSPARPAAAGGKTSKARASSQQTRRYRIQLGAFRNPKYAEAVRNQIIDAIPQDLRKQLAVAIVTSDKDNNVLHRIFASPVDRLATAQFICSQIKARLPKQGCFVLRTKK